MVAIRGRSKSSGSGQDFAVATKAHEGMLERETLVRLARGGSDAAPGARSLEQHRVSWMAKNPQRVAQHRTGKRL